MRPVTDALRLIRLLDGTLPAGEGAELREQLANDESLRREWRRVISVLGQPASTTTREEIDPFEGAEQIAARVEGNDVSDCGFAANEHVVRELASLDRWQRATDAADVHVPAAVRDRMAGVVLEHIQPRSSRIQSVPRGTSHRVNGVYREVQPSAVDRPVVRRNSQRRRRFENRQVTWAVSIVAGIVLLSLIGWRAMWNPAREVRPDIDDVADGTIDHHDLPQPSIDVPSHQADESDPVPHPEAGDAPSQLVHQSPEEMFEVEEDVVPLPPTPPATIARRETLEWQQIVGIVVSSDSESTGWRGALAPAKHVDSTDAVAPPIAIRSLRESWGRAGTASGIELTLGAETLVSLAVEVAEVQTVRASLERGAFAVGGLARDAVVQCETISMSISLRSIVDGSRIAFIENGDLPSVLVFTGEVAVGDLVVAAPAGIEWTGGGELRITSTVRPIAWLEPPTRVPAEQEWLNVCLAEADVVSALLQADSGQSDRTLTAAADWCIALDAAQAVPLAAASGESIHRDAALAWLLDATHEADRQAAVWNNLGPTLAETELGVAHWFEVARGDADVTPDVLQELAIGVGPNQRLFVRHASIRFLREATGQRFAAYDPESPTQGALAEIRAFVRQLTRPSTRQQRSGRP